MNHLSPAAFRPAAYADSNGSLCKAAGAARVPLLGARLANYFFNL